MSAHGAMRKRSSSGSPTILAMAEPYTTLRQYRTYSKNKAKPYPSCPSLTRRFSHATLKLYSAGYSPMIATFLLAISRSPWNIQDIRRDVMAVSVRGHLAPNPSHKYLCNLEAAQGATPRRKTRLHFAEASDYA